MGGLFFYASGIRKKNEGKIKTAELYQQLFEGYSEREEI